MKTLHVLLMVTLASLWSVPSSAAQGTCPPNFDGYLEPLLAVGDIARVTLGGPANNVRAEPSTSAEIVFRMEPGVEFVVTDGPACSDGIVWWEVDLDGEFGWTAESNLPVDANAYYLEPVVMAGFAAMDPIQTLPTGATTLTWSGGGLLIVAPSGDANRVDLWDIDMPQQYDMIFEHGTPSDGFLGEAEIWFYDESDDESLIATGDYTNRLKFWDAALTPLGEVQAQLVPDFESDYALDADFETAAISGCAELAPDESCEFGAADVFDVTTLEFLFRLEGHNGAMSAIAFSPDGSFIATGGTDGSLLLWDAETGDLAAELPSDTVAIGALAFNPESDFLAVAGCAEDNGEVDETRECLAGVASVYNYLDDTLIQTFDAYDYGITSVDFNADGNLLATAAPGDGEVLVWDINSGGLLQTYPVDAEVIAFSPGGAELAASDGESLTVWPAPVG